MMWLLVPIAEFVVIGNTVSVVISILSTTFMYAWSPKFVSA